MELEDVGRRRPVHLGLDDVGTRSNIVFLTVCTKDRKKILASSEATEILQTAWRQADHWLVGRWIVLPDHLHLFCAPGRREALPLERWVRYWKSLATRSWPHRDDLPLWQSHFWDRQLRHGDSYDGKWHYVMKNPVRHGFAKDADDWPYQGTMNTLRWHD